MSRLYALLILAVAGLASAPAHAAQYLYTLTGHLDPGAYNIDENQLFGPSLASGFVAEFLVDDAVPQALYSYGTTGSSAAGGWRIAAGSARPVSGTLSVGGQSHAIYTGNSLITPVYDPVQDEYFGDYFSQQDAGGVGKDSDAKQMFLGAGYEDSYDCCFPLPHYIHTSRYDDLAFILASSGFTDPDYRQLGTFLLDPGDSFGLYQFGGEVGPGQPGLFTNLALRPETLTVTLAGAVPEVATWLMMIVGIGAVGCAARRRGWQDPVRAAA